MANDPNSIRDALIETIRAEIAAANRHSVVELRLRSDWAEDEPYQPYLVELNIITLVNLERRVIHFAPTKVGQVVHPDDWGGFIKAFKESRSIVYNWHGAVEA